MMNNTMVNESGNNVVVVEKLTKKDCFNLLMNLVLESGSENVEKLTEFIQKEINALDKKTSKAREKKSTGASLTIRNNILEVLGEKEEPISVGDMLEDNRLTTYKDGEDIVKMSSPKLVAALTKLKEEGLVERTVIKKRAYYSLVR